MNNLTTRKIVLGLLMTLVLAFSVQGTADALTSLTKSSGHLDNNGDGAIIRDVIIRQHFRLYGSSGYFRRHRAYYRTLLEASATDH